MDDNETRITGPQDRRELLKKLGIAAGALVWSTPVVQTLSAGTAGAQQGCHDISHLDLIVLRDGKGPYGIQWDPGEGWGKHPTSSKHCLDGYTWSQPPSSVLKGIPTPTGNAQSYTVTLPAGMTIVSQDGQLVAFSKAGQECQRAVSLGGNTYRFDRWCSGTTTTTTTTHPTTTTTEPTTTTTEPGGPQGSPGPVHDISHMDLVVGSSATGPWYGVQYEFGAGWTKHPKGNANKEHCLFGLRSWSGSVPSSLLTALRQSTVSPAGSGRYLIEIPTSVWIRTAAAGSGYTHEAFSKCASDKCTPASVVTSGSKHRVTFRPCPKSG